MARRKATSAYPPFWDMLDFEQKARFLSFYDDVEFPDHPIVSGQLYDGTERFRITHADIDAVYGHPIGPFLGDDTTEDLREYYGVQRIYDTPESIDKEFNKKFAKVFKEEGEEIFKHPGFGELGSPRAAFLDRSWCKKSYDEWKKANASNEQAKTAAKGSVAK